MQDGGGKRFSQLYDDALQRHAKAKQDATWLPEQYTFKPQLSARAPSHEFLVASEHSSISACDRSGLLLVLSVCRSRGWTLQLPPSTPPSQPVTGQACSGNVGAVSLQC